MNDEPETPPVESWKRKTNIGAIASLSIIFAAVIVIAIATLWIKIPVADLVGYFVLILGIVILSVLSNRYIFIDVAVRRFVSGYFRFTGWMLISLGPLVVFNALSRYVLSNLLFRYQLMVFIVWAVLLAWAIVLIFTDKKREALFRRLQQLGSFTPLVYAFNLSMIAITFFSSVTYVLATRGAIALNVTGKTDVTHGAITDFYLWHFLNAIPFLKVNETLRWREPLTYESGWIGLALLVFKLLVILPVIAAFAWYWKQVNSKSDSE